MASLNINDELRAFAEAQAKKEGLPGAEAYVEALLVDAKHYAKDANGRNGGVRPPVDFDSEQTLEALAAEQGVGPIRNISELRGHFWPEDETPDDFIAAVREWRREGHKGGIR